MAAASAQQSPLSDAQAEQRTLVEFACKAAETFVAAYYAAADAPGRGSVSVVCCCCCCCRSCPFAGLAVWLCAVGLWGCGGCWLCSPRCCALVHAAMPIGARGASRLVGSMRTPLHPGTLGRPVLPSAATIERVSGLGQTHTVTLGARITAQLGPRLASLWALLLPRSAPLALALATPVHLSLTSLFPFSLRLRLVRAVADTSTHTHTHTWAAHPDALSPRLDDRLERHARQWTRGHGAAPGRHAGLEA